MNFVSYSKHPGCSIGSVPDPERLNNSGLQAIPNMILFKSKNYDAE